MSAPSLPAARVRALERVREIILETLEGLDARVVLFGSSATGAVRHSSDIDVALEAREPLPPAMLAALRDRLDESRVPYDVDVVDLRTASPEFRARVRREGVVWRG